MNCRIYKNLCCINETEEDFTEENLNDYCCSNCLIHIVVEHDKQLEEETISN